MISNDVGRQLHDRYTRDQTLSASELADLEQWYAQMDEQESEMLARMAPSSTLVELEGQVTSAISHLNTVAQRIQTLTAGNARLRQENSDLQRQL